MGGGTCTSRARINIKHIILAFIMSQSRRTLVNSDHTYFPSAAPMCDIAVAEVKTAQSDDRLRARGDAGRLFAVRAGPPYCKYLDLHPNAADAVKLHNLFVPR